MYIKRSTITPDQVLAGDSYQFILTLTAGKDFKGEGDRIILDMPAYLGYSRGSRLHQEMPGYINVICSNPELNYTQRMWNMESGDYVGSGSSSFMGMAARMFVLDFLEGQGKEGDIIRIYFGHTLNGFGQGAKVTTIVPSPDFKDSFHVRFFSQGQKNNAGLPDLGRSFKGYTRPVPDQEAELVIAIEPREPERVRVIRHPGSTCLAVLDRFANPVALEKIPSATAGLFRLPGIFKNPALTPTGQNTYRIDDPAAEVVSVTEQEPGIHINNAPRTDRVWEDYNLYFGDIHTHSGHSNDCIEREKNIHSPGESYLYARDVAALDFLAVTDHHQPWDVERNKIGAPLWSKLVEQAQDMDKPGVFTAFAGLEYRSSRGDTAVVFKNYPDYDKLDNPSLSEVDKWWDAMKGEDMLTIPHFHNPGRLEDQTWIPARETVQDLPDSSYYHTEPVLEIFSCHGSYEYEGVLEHHIPDSKSSRPDRYGRWFLDQGYRYGFIANSDGHKGHPGTNGLTAVFARENTKEAIFEAIRNRRCYGTTNARIKLLTTLDGKLLGSELPFNVQGHELYIDVETEEPIKYVEIIMNGKSHRRFTPVGYHFKDTIKVKPQNPGYIYIRVIQQDNGAAFSSPFFLF
jgi:hypothetical protein